MELNLPVNSDLPIYRQIADVITAALESGQVLPGQKLPPHVSLARMLGVNPFTVSRGYEFLENRGIIRQRRGAGAFVELDALEKIRQASKRRIGTLTIVLGEPSLAQCRRETAFVGMNILDGLREEISDRDTQWIIAESFTENFLKNIKQGDAIAFLGAKEIDVALLERMLHEGIPIVSVTAGNPLPNVPKVVYDRIQSTTLACQYLISCGYQRIGFIGSKSINDANLSAKYYAFNSVLHDAGLSVHGQYIRDVNVDPGRAYAAARDMLETGDLPEAFFVDTDYKAMEVVCALASAGVRVPENVGIVAYDNIPEAAQFHPPLTTVAVPRHQMGRVAGQMLLTWLNSGQVPDDVMLTSKLVIRQSTISRLVQPTS